LPEISSKGQICLSFDRVQKNVFLKPNPVGFWGFWGFIGFLDKQEKIGKIIQKTQ